MNSQTIKLYDENAYGTEFTAKVLHCEKADSRENLYAVTLDRTLFFPEEGGQTPDRGVLILLNEDDLEKLKGEADNLFINDARKIEVLDVQIKNDSICHYLEEELPEGSTIYGKIDWEHRFSNMQQHSGEHVFSGIVNSRFGYDNVGFHLSDSVVTMDYSGQLTEEELKNIEKSVNRAIYENREIRAWYPAENELSEINYRSKKELSGAVRIVEVDGYDVCACCAPHVKRTGEIGILKVINSQNYKGGTRVSILCGFRALEYFYNEHAMIQKLAGEMSTGIENVPAQFKKQQEEMSELKRKLSESCEKLLLKEAESLPENSQNACLFTDGDIDPNVIRRVVNSLVEKRGGYCGIFFGSDKDGYRFIIGSGAGLNSNAVLAELRKNYEVRGGGKPAMVQGSIEGASAQDISSVF
ncbi:alanyl-tRNA editing protein [Butyrivibrio sp. AC2005]|uniref:alanyl-tRNA editing protein n=1 Tax=Butyrivibrio sp. AC2005 TaxID=1280672 RepID=UPI0003FA647C|nr:DHHA1 domain-containing protein [Butyrivibrio sp. AC2005]